MTRMLHAAETRRRAARQGEERDAGFTLIELMVVIIIIGILAAIAIPAFFNQRQAAWDASVKSDLSNIAVAAESYSVASSGTYVGMTLGATGASPTGLRGLYGLKTTAGNLFKLDTASLSTSSYTVRAYNTYSGVAKTYTLSTGTITGPTTGTAISPSD